MKTKSVTSLLKKELLSSSDKLRPDTNILDNDTSTNRELDDVPIMKEEVVGCGVLARVGKSPGVDTVTRAH